MFQICVLEKIVQRKKQVLRFWNFLKMKWLGTSKYIIFLTLLKFQNIWNLINVFQNCFNENVHLNVSYDFSKFDGSKKIKVWHS
jgi:hypothetical protein